MFFGEGDLVLVSPPENRRATKLSPGMMGPFVVLSRERDKLYKIQELISTKTLVVPAERMQLFRVNADEDPVVVASVDLDEYVVEKIMGHQGSTLRDLKFLVKWKYFGEEYNQYLAYNELKDNVELHNYIKNNCYFKKYKNIWKRAFEG
jgi:hypothetical protein